MSEAPLAAHLMLRAALQHTPVMGIIVSGSKVNYTFSRCLEVWHENNKIGTCLYSGLSPYKAITIQKCIAWWVVNADNYKVDI